MHQEIQPLVSSSNTAAAERYSGSCCRPILQHKVVLLILVWTLIVGELNTFLQFLVEGFIEQYVPIVQRNNFSNAVSSPVSFWYAILAMISVLYPISGFIADVCCGRFRTVIIGLCCILIFFLSVVVLGLAWVCIGNPYRLISLDPLKQVITFYIIGFGTLPFLVFGIAAYQANFIQFGLDQMLDAPSIQLSLFIHLAIWSDISGTTLMTICGAVISCPTLSIKLKVLFGTIPMLLLVCSPLILIFSCCKHHWFYTEATRQNPYKNVIKVLNYVRKHKYPLLRSAFTYTGDERPSRMDYAKERYGGPFTTEQVEDVKTLLRILGLLLSLGSVFVMEIPTSFIGFKVFGLHTGYREDFINDCTRWAIFESSALRHSITFIFLPVYMYLFVVVRRSSLFARMFAGFLIYIVGTLSMLAIDVAGHFHHVNDQNTGSHCMFTYTRDNNAHALTYPILELHWAVLIAPNVLLGIGPPILMCTVFEFILAQSPHSMKGLLVGVFFTIKGFFQLVSSIVLIPISSDRIWVRDSIIKHAPVTNCGFIYLLFTVVTAAVGLVLFSVVMKRYKYRERDDRPYDQSIVEEIFDRRNRMRSPPSDYDNLT